MGRRIGWAPVTKRLCAHYALGVIERYLDSMRCVLCRREDAKERSAQRRIDKPEECRAANEKWRNEHKEEIALAGKKRYADPEKRAEANRRSKQWSLDHPEERREQGRKAKGIVWFPGQSEATLLEAQGGRCANPACRVEFSTLPRKQIHVDHDHNIIDGSPNVRGLLCMFCNVGSGKFKDDPELLKGQAAYLEAWKTRLLG